MTRFSTLNIIHAKAQQEVFAQLENAGRRFPVVFSHFLFTYLNKKARKGAYTQLSHPASGDFARRLSLKSTKEVTNSLPVTGCLASANMSSTNNTFFNLSFV